MSETATPAAMPPPPPQPTPDPTDPASPWHITPHGLVPDGALTLGLADSLLVQWYLPEDADEGGGEEPDESGGTDAGGGAP